MLWVFHVPIDSMAARVRQVNYQDSTLNESPAESRFLIVLYMNKRADQSRRLVLNNFIDWSSNDIEITTDLQTGFLCSRKMKTVQ